MKKYFQSFLFFIFTYLFIGHSCISAIEEQEDCLFFSLSKLMEVHDKAVTSRHANEWKLNAKDERKIIGVWNLKASNNEKLSKIFQILMQARMKESTPFTKYLMNRAFRHSGKGIYNTIFGQHVVKLIGPYYDRLFNRVQLLNAKDVIQTDSFINIHEFDHALFRNENFLLSLVGLLVDGTERSSALTITPFGAINRFSMETRAIGAQWEMVHRIPKKKRLQLMAQLRKAELDKDDIALAQEFLQFKLGEKFNTALIKNLQQGKFYNWKDGHYIGVASFVDEFAYRSMVEDQQELIKSYLAGTATPKATEAFNMILWDGINRTVEEFKPELIKSEIIFNRINKDKKILMKSRSKSMELALINALKRNAFDKIKLEMKKEQFRLHLHPNYNLIKYGMDFASDFSVLPHLADLERSVSEMRAQLQNTSRLRNEMKRLFSISLDNASLSKEEFILKVRREHGYELKSIKQGHYSWNYVKKVLLGISLVSLSTIPLLNILSEEDIEFDLNTVSRLIKFNDIKLYLYLYSLLFSDET